MDLNSQHSFVVLVYKQSEYLEACLESLMQQTSPSPVLLSTSTPSIWLDDIARRYQLEIKVRQGVSSIVDDWNFAMAQAVTDYVTLVHQDDIYQPGYAAAVKDAIGRTDDHLILFSDYAEWIDNHVRTHTANLMIKRLLLLPFWIKSSIRNRSIKRLILSLGNPIACPSVTYHKAVLTDFTFSKDYSINLDWDAWLNLADRQGCFLFLRQPLVWHRIYRQSETSFGLKDKRRQQDDYRIFKRLWPKAIAGLLSRLYALSYRSNAG